MAERGYRRGFIVVGFALLALLSAATFVWRDDILRAALDPKEPFQIYRPPPPPNYASREAWGLLPADPSTPTDSDPPADVFFISPTTFDGGRHWNAPIDNARADRLFRRVMAPNYAGPFVRVGRLFAPRYRQASLYTLTTLREDARDARKFAYGDVAAAFRQILCARGQSGATVLRGWGGAGRHARRPPAGGGGRHQPCRCKARLAGAYMIEAVTPADAPPICHPASAVAEAGCLAAWASAFDGDIGGAQDIQNRSLVWAKGGDLGKPQRAGSLCVSTRSGAPPPTRPRPAKLGLGATNATGLEWGARPAFLTRQVSAVCKRWGASRSPGRSRPC